MRFMIGADPELMLEHEGKLKSAIGIVPGTKHVPHRLEKGAAQHDNVMCEFNVDPASTPGEFVENIRTVLIQLDKIVRPARMKVQASADFPDSELADPEARAFGCDPDFDAWRLEVIKVSPKAAGASLRSAGGHLHLGTVKGKPKFLLDDYGKVDVVKTLDIIIGIPSVFLDKDPTANKRRSLYGRAGCHRPKEYGVEYRTLGNWWIKGPKTVSLVYRLAEEALSLVESGKYKDLINELGEDNIQDIINKSLVDVAREQFFKIAAPFISKSVANDIKRLETNNLVGDLYSEWRI